jgi:hypothetical protein
MDGENCYEKIRTPMISTSMKGEGEVWRGKRERGEEGERSRTLSLLLVMDFSPRYYREEVNY